MERKTCSSRFLMGRRTLQPFYRQANGETERSGRLYFHQPLNMFFILFFFLLLSLSLGFVHYLLMKMKHVSPSLPLNVLEFVSLSSIQRLKHDLHSLLVLLFTSFHSSLEMEEKSKVVSTWRGRRRRELQKKEEEEKRVVVIFYLQTRREKISREKSNDREKEIKVPSPLLYG